MQHHRWMAGAAAAAVMLVATVGPAMERGDLARPVRMAQVTAATPETTGRRTPPEAAATLLERDDVQGILGRKVLSSADEDMGRVVDVVVDRNGQVRAAVIDFGGFLGVGNRKIAVDWNALHFAPTGSKYDRITLELTRDQVKAAPEYKDGQPLVVVGTAESLQP